MLSYYIVVDCIIVILCYTMLGLTAARARARCELASCDDGPVLHMCLQACMHACIHTYIHIHACVHTYGYMNAHTL